MAEVFGLNDDMAMNLGTAGDEDELLRRRMMAVPRPPMPPPSGVSMLGRPDQQPTSDGGSLLGRQPVQSASASAQPVAPAERLGGLGRLGLIPKVPESEIEPGPQQRRLGEMMRQPEPQLHGWRKGLDIAGQIAAPGIESRIPGTPGAYRAGLERQQGLADVENKQQSAVLNRRGTAAEAVQRGALAEKAMTATPDKVDRKPEDLTFEYLTKPVAEGGAGMTPDAAYQKLQEMGQIGKTGATAQPKLTYDQGIPVTVTGPKGTFDVNDPAMPAEYQPLVRSAKAAHQQERTEKTADEMKKEGFAAGQQARVFAQQERERQARDEQLSTSTKAMVEAAPKVKAFIARIKPLIDQLQGELGPAVGRWTDFWAGKVGTKNPQFIRLKTDYGYLQTMMMKMHVGSRGGEYIMKHFEEILNAGKQDPANMKAALDETERYADELITEGQQRIGAPAGQARGPGIAQPGAAGGGPAGAGSIKIIRDANGRIIEVK